MTVFNTRLEAGHNFPEKNLVVWLPPTPAGLNLTAPYVDLLPPRPGSLRLLCLITCGDGDSPTPHPPHHYTRIIIKTGGCLSHQMLGSVMVSNSSYFMMLMS